MAPSDLPIKNGKVSPSLFFDLNMPTSPILTATEFFLTLSSNHTLLDTLANTHIPVARLIHPTPTQGSCGQQAATQSSARVHAPPKSRALHLMIPLHQWKLYGVWYVIGFGRETCQSQNKHIIILKDSVCRFVQWLLYLYFILSFNALTLPQQRTGKKNKTKQKETETPQCTRTWGESVLGGS